MRVLILDDDKLRHDYFAEILPECQITHCYDAFDAMAAFNQGITFDMVSLDHDLGAPSGYGMPEMTGADVASFMVEKNIPKPRIVVVHSVNPVGSANIVQILKAGGFNVLANPFNLQRRGG